MQQQDGGVDCGLFAIAFATELAYGNDPVQVSYVQSAMQDHLLLCLEQGEMKLFPRLIYKTLILVHETIWRTAEENTLD